MLCREGVLRYQSGIRPLARGCSLLISAMYTRNVHNGHSFTHMVCMMPFSCPPAYLQNRKAVTASQMQRVRGRFTKSEPVEGKAQPPCSVSGLEFSMRAGSMQVWECVQAQGLCVRAFKTRCRGTSVGRVPARACVETAVGVANVELQWLWHSAAGGRPCPSTPTAAR